MDQHNAPSSTLQGVRRTANTRRVMVQHRRIKEEVQKYFGFHLLKIIFPTTIDKYIHSGGLRQGTFRDNLALSPLLP